MGSHNWQARPSGYNLFDKTNWYDDKNVLQLKYEDDYPFDQTVRIRAHGASQDSTTNDVYHSIKVQVFEGLTCMNFSLIFIIFSVFL